MFVVDSAKKTKKAHEARRSRATHTRLVETSKADANVVSLFALHFTPRMSDGLVTAACLA